jgi:hypothetical protein
MNLSGRFRSFYPETTPHCMLHPEGWVDPRLSPEAMEARKPSPLISPAVEFLVTFEFLSAV